MSTDSSDRAARRRAHVRAGLGRPGSFQRWLIATLVWLFACGLASLFVPWGVRIIIFLFAVLVPVAGWKARSILVGDEDEFRAGLRRETSRGARASAHDEDEVRLDPSEWLSRSTKQFDDVPPPPIADEEQSGNR